METNQLCPGIYCLILSDGSDYLRVIGAWETHEVKQVQKPIREEILHKHYHNSTGDWDIAYINRTTKINVNGILIEYEGEDSGIGLLFASKAAVQVGHYADVLIGTWDAGNAGQGR